MSYNSDNPNNYESFTFETETTPAHASGVIIFNATSGFIVSDGSQWLSIERDQITEMSGIFGSPTSGESLEFNGAGEIAFVSAVTHSDELDEFDDVLTGAAPISGDLLFRDGSTWEKAADPTASDIHTISGFPEVDILALASGQALSYKASGYLYSGSEDLTSNLSGVYRLGDSAAVGTDDMGNFNLTSVTTSATISGIDGYGQEFGGDGNAHWVRRNWASSFGYNTAGDAYAFDVWFKRDSSIDQDTNGIIFALSDGGPSRACFLLDYNRSSQNIRFRVYDYFGGIRTITSSTNSAPEDEWHHAFGIVHSSATPSLRLAFLYLNASLVGSGTYSTLTKGPDTSMHVAFGKINNTSTEFGGQIDNAHFWAKRNMSGVHATEMYNGGLGLTYNSGVGDFVESFSGSPSFRNREDEIGVDIATTDLTDYTGSPVSGDLMSYSGSSWTPVAKGPDIYTEELVGSGTVSSQSSFDIDDFIDDPDSAHSFKIILSDVVTSSTTPIYVRVLQKNSSTSTVTEVTDRDYSWNKSLRLATSTTDYSYVGTGDDKWAFYGNKVAGSNYKGFAVFKFYMSTKPNSNNGKYGGSSAGNYAMNIAINGTEYNTTSFGRRGNVQGLLEYSWPGSAGSHEYFHGLRFYPNAGNISCSYWIYRIG